MTKICEAYTRIHGGQNYPMGGRVQKNQSGRDWTGLDPSHSKGFRALRTCVKSRYAGLDGTNPGLI